MFVVTGGAGFIGSAVVWKLNAEGIDDILVVDRLGDTEKWRNLVSLRYRDYLHKDRFLERVVEDRVPFPVEGVIHMGACSSTTERDGDYLMENNFHYSCRVAEWAVAKGVPMIYASSAATYGDGSLGSPTNDACRGGLRPLNLYGIRNSSSTCGCSERGGNAAGGPPVLQRVRPNEFHKGRCEASSPSPSTVPGHGERSVSSGPTAPPGGTGPDAGLRVREGTPSMWSGGWCSTGRYGGFSTWARARPGPGTTW
jgi:ADP-L-glycero-D-manno-heptose 6-epimerase